MGSRLSWRARILIGCGNWIGGVVGFGAGAVLARQIGRSIFNSQISIQPVLLPVILAIAVIVTFAGSAAAIRRAVGLDPVFALRGEL